MVAFSFARFRKGIWEYQNKDKEIIPLRGNLFFFALEQECREKHSLCIVMVRTNATSRPNIGKAAERLMILGPTAKPAPKRRSTRLAT